MALPDYYKVEAGTTKTWKSSGGDYAITCTSLADAAAREGAKGDLGAAWARRYEVTFEFKLTSAGANGTEVELYTSQSDSATAGTNNEGNATGADAALSNPAETKQLMTPIGSVPVSNALGTGTQRKKFEFCPTSRYQIPVVVNRAGVAFSSTAADTIIVFKPLEELIQETV